MIILKILHIVKIDGNHDFYEICIYKWKINNFYKVVGNYDVDSKKDVFFKIDV